jgi:hypothetical protein
MDLSHHSSRCHGNQQKQGSECHLYQAFHDIGLQSPPTVQWLSSEEGAQQQ